MQNFNEESELVTDFRLKNHWYLVYKKRRKKPKILLCRTTDILSNKMKDMVITLSREKKCMK